MALVPSCAWRGAAGVRYSAIVSPSLEDLREYSANYILMIYGEVPHTILPTSIYLILV